jgi:hypothetical protein
MDQNKPQELTLSEILLQLRELTTERKRVGKANDTFTLLFAPIVEQSKKVPTWEEHRDRVDALAAKIPSFSVWWEPRHSVYALIPEMKRETERQELA